MKHLSSWVNAQRFKNSIVHLKTRRKIRAKFSDCNFQVSIAFTSIGRVATNWFKLHLVVDRIIGPLAHHCPSLAIPDFDDDQWICILWQVLRLEYSYANLVNGELRPEFLERHCGRKSIADIGRVPGVICICLTCRLFVSRRTRNFERDGSWFIRGRYKAAKTQMRNYSCEMCVWCEEFYIKKVSYWFYNVSPLSTEMIIFYTFFIFLPSSILHKSILFYAKYLKYINANGINFYCCYKKQIVRIF